MNGNFRTSVVISTTAEKKRGDSLLRAIETVTTEQTEPALPVIIANGQIYDPDLLDFLKSKQDLRFFYLPEGNLPKARNFGRQMVDTEFFGFLDDDDAYLPRTLHSRVSALAEDPEIDALISNGYRMTGGTKKLFIPDMAVVEADPPNSLMAENWLASCGGLYRTSTVGTEYFSPDIKDLEWTFTALRLVTSRRLAFLNEPAFVYNETPGSLSRNPKYIESLPSTIAQLMELDLPKNLTRHLQAKFCAAYHHLSDTQRVNREFRASWRNHLRSMSYPVGLLRYAGYTRRLLLDRRAR